MSRFTAAVPNGEAISVRIIDSTSRISQLPLSYLMAPPLPGVNHLPDATTWSFLIEHKSGRKIMFDLGIPVDWKDLPPASSDRLKDSGWEISVEKSIIEILKEQNVDPGSIEAVIWSHWHWDHIGNVSHFPPSTKLVVGPGFKEEFLPAYPTNPDAKHREVDFENRELLEITFTESSALDIAPFRAFDYFGDGSFYLLDTPGHATGHIAGLARTSTGPDTFIFMGGDLTHHGGELRPSPLKPLPASIPPTLAPLLCQHLAYTTACPCPGSIFEPIQSSRNREPYSTTPFFDPAMGKDIPQAIETIKKTQIADADNNIWYVFAHDSKVKGIATLFPGSANDWKEKGWREKTFWAFLDDFKVAVQKVKGKNA